MGGSESRFILSPAFENRDLYVQSPSRNAEEPLVLGPLNHEKFHLKFVIQPDGDFVHLGLEKHPQLYFQSSVKKSPPDNDLILINRNHSTLNAKWRMFSFGKKKSCIREIGRFTNPSEKPSLEWKAMKENIQLVGFYNEGSGGFLSYRRLNTGQLAPCIVYAEDEYSHETTKEEMCLWEMEGVDRNLSANEVGMAVLAPLTLAAFVSGGLALLVKPDLITSIKGVEATMAWGLASGYICAETKVGDGEFFVLSSGMFRGIRVRKSVEETLNFCVKLLTAARRLIVGGDGE